MLYIDGHVEWARTPLAGVNGDNIFIAGKILTYKGDETPVSPTDSFMLPAYSGN